MGDEHIKPPVIILCDKLSILNNRQIISLMNTNKKIETMAVKKGKCTRPLYKFTKNGYAHLPTVKPYKYASNWNKELLFLTNLLIPSLL